MVIRSVLKNIVVIRSVLKNIVVIRSVLKKEKNKQNKLPFFPQIK